MTISEDKHIPRFISSIPWLLMIWRHQHLWHQQPWYWPCLPGIVHASNGKSFFNENGKFNIIKSSTLSAVVTFGYVYARTVDHEFMLWSWLCLVYQALFYLLCVIEVSSDAAVCLFKCMFAFRAFQQRLGIYRILHQGTWPTAPPN